jgi:hypothetical protein
LTIWIPASTSACGEVAPVASADGEGELVEAEGAADSEADGVEAPPLTGCEDGGLAHATVTASIETANAAAVRR